MLPVSWVVSFPMSNFRPNELTCRAESTCERGSTSWTRCNGRQLCPTTPSLRSRCSLQCGDNLKNIPFLSFAFRGLNTTNFKELCLTVIKTRPDVRSTNSLPGPPEALAMHLTGEVWPTSIKRGVMTHVFRSTSQMMTWKKFEVSDQEELSTTQNVNHSFLVISCLSGLFGQLTFWKLTISPNFVLLFWQSSYTDSSFN